MVNKFTYEFDIDSQRQLAIALEERYKILSARVGRLATHPAPDASLRGQRVTAERALATVEEMMLQVS